MKYGSCFLFFLCQYFFCIAQYKVIFKLVDLPVKHTKDTIFLAGNFNNWNPHDTPFSISAVKESVLYLQPGNYEYKSTRGSWSTTECNKDGKDISNYQFTISGDTVIEVKIEAWKDDFKTEPKKHTATQQVFILDSAFNMPQLNKTRRIWIYLPQGYSKTKKHYPVIYMHDGQNLFDDFTSGFGEWGVDECLDSMTKKGRQACIVVGIDNGIDRMSEYNPYEFILPGRGGDSSRKFLAQGTEYVNFITETLKPFIDAKYRTLPTAENTIIAGSSMGGLISYYAILTHTDVFGKAGIFSPAFWTAPAIRNLTDSLAAKCNGKFFFYMGGKEGDDMIKDMQEIQELLGQKSKGLIYSVIDSAGVHNERAWRKWFAEFYVWITADGYNTVINTNN